MGLTLSAALAPSEAEAQEAAGTAAAPAEATGTHGMQPAPRASAPIAMSDGTAAMSDGMSDERVRNQKPRRLPEQSRRNNCPSALNRQTARFRRAGLPQCVRRVMR